MEERCAKRESLSFGQAKATTEPSMRFFSCITVYQLVEAQEFRAYFNKFPPNEGLLAGFVEIEISANAICSLAVSALDLR